LTSTTNSQLEANHNRSIDPPGKSLQSWWFHDLSSMNWLTVPFDHRYRF
jgi:hypothetical protein